jgi:hypothetical protein
MRILRCAAGIGLCLLAAGATAAAADEAAPATVRLEVAATFEGARLYRADCLSVIELTGSYREMGRQYGALLRTELTDLYQLAIEQQYIGTMHLSPERIDTISRSLYDRYPRRYQEILLGMAETSGLGVANQLRLNALEWFPKIYHLQYPRCSGVAAWGTNTLGRPLVFGRNNDDTEFFSQFARYMVVAVFKPNDGSLPVAVINYAGVIYVATAMNSAGLFLELNSGTQMGLSLSRVSIFTTLFTILQDYPSLAAARRPLLSTLADISAIVNVADPTGASSFEISLYDSRECRPTDRGFLAATNHFVDPTWPFAQIDESIASGTTLQRYANILKLGRQYRGRFSPQVMMQLLDTTIPNGGPTEVHETIFQVVAEPASRRIWIKMPRVQDWTGLDLAPVFGGE